MSLMVCNHCNKTFPRTNRIMDKFEVWMIHPESETNSKDAEFDSIEKCVEYIKDQGPLDGGLGWFEIKKDGSIVENWNSK